MFILKLIGKVFAFPLIVILVIVLGAVKLLVGIYSLARGLFAVLMGTVVVLTIYYYQDWLQVGLVLVLVGISTAVLAGGVLIEVLIETVLQGLGDFILS